MRWRQYHQWLWMRVLWVNLGEEWQLWWFSAKHGILREKSLSGDYLKPRNLSLSNDWAILISDKLSLCMGMTTLKIVTYVLIGETCEVLPSTGWPEVVTLRWPKKQPKKQPKSHSFCSIWDHVATRRSSCVSCSRCSDGSGPSAHWSSHNLARCPSPRPMCQALTTDIGTDKYWFCEPFPISSATYWYSCLWRVWQRNWMQLWTSILASKRPRTKSAM